MLKAPEDVQMRWMYFAYGIDIDLGERAWVDYKVLDSVPSNVLVTMNLRMWFYLEVRSLQIELFKRSYWIRMDSKANDW